MYSNQAKQNKKSENETSGKEREAYLTGILASCQSRPDVYKYIGFPRNTGTGVNNKGHTMNLPTCIL